MTQEQLKLLERLEYALQDAMRAIHIVRNSFAELNDPIPDLSGDSSVLEELSDKDPLYDPIVWLRNARAIFNCYSGRLDKFEKGLCSDPRPKSFRPSDNQVNKLKTLIVRLNWELQ
jgi:hypothetical protein